MVRSDHMSLRLRFQARGEGKLSIHDWGKRFFFEEQ